MRMRAAALLGACLILAATGCVRRTIEITSTPPDATVWLNGREIGRTPCEAEFLFYGDYDVRLEKAGYEVVEGRGAVNAPFWDFVGADLVAEAFPGQLHSRTAWHFGLRPAERDVGSVQARARDLQDVLTARPAPSADAVRGPAAPQPSIGSTMVPARGASVPVPPTFGQSPSGPP